MYVITFLNYMILRANQFFRLKKSKNYPLIYLLIYLFIYFITTDIALPPQPGRLGLTVQYGSHK